MADAAEQVFDEELDDGFLRLPGLFRRFELPDVLELGSDYHFEDAGGTADGEPLIAVYVRSRQSERAIEPGGTERAAIAFCSCCDSGLVDVRGWQTERLAIFRCMACGHEAVVDGFTIGRVYDLPAAVMRGARADLARSRVLMLHKPEAKA